MIVIKTGLHGCRILEDFWHTVTKSRLRNTITASYMHLCTSQQILRLEAAFQPRNACKSVGFETRGAEIKTGHKNDRPIDFVHSSRPRSRPRQGKVEIKTTGLKPNAGVQYLLLVEIEMLSQFRKKLVPAVIKDIRIMNCRNICIWLCSPILSLSCTPHNDLASYVNLIMQHRSDVMPWK